MHPIVKLAASAQPGERKYILFAGAGLSRDAGLPTAWDLMLATASILSSGEESGLDKDLEAWFKESKYARMTYSELIGSLFPTPVEQRSFVQEKLRANRVGDAHRLIAELAKMGVIRCAITTNFDELLERALEEAGVPVQVIANSDDLHHSEPLIHCKSFRVYKPHGTLASGHLRNTPHDLERLPSDMEEELIKVMTEHGLLIVGYGGQDNSILRCFQARRHHRYPAFWVNPRKPASEVCSLFQTDTFNYIECRGAATFFKDLMTTYERMAAFVPNPGLPSTLLEARNSILACAPDAEGLVAKFMASLDEEIAAVAPDFTKGGEWDELLVQAIDKSVGIVVHFSKIAEAIAEQQANREALVLYKGFGKILNRYDVPRGFSGTVYNKQFDLHKFIGHELFVCFFSLLLKHNRWEMCVTLLDEEIYVTNQTVRGLVPFKSVSEYVRLLDDRNTRLGLNRVSVEADILKQRHSQGELGSIVPFRDFMDADLFLFLRAEFQFESGPESYNWYPLSVVFMSGEPPLYLVEAERVRYASRLLAPLALKSTDDFRAKLPAMIKKLNNLFGRGFGILEKPLGNYDPNKIASRG